jgi:hypothetical protein
MARFTTCYLSRTHAGPSLYQDTADLLTLDLCRSPDTTINAQLGLVRTPLNHSAWEAALSDHPDRAFARYIVAGIRDGFRIGFNRTQLLRSAPRNMFSAREHPEVIQAYLEKERSMGRLLSPFAPESLSMLPPLQVNRFGVIPKGHNTGKWRLITDLSYPPGQSVNDGIDPELCSLSYTSVEAVARVVAAYPPGALLAKVDIESVYRLVPVHPSDRPLQAMQWDSALFVDPMLPFGLRSAPKIFNAIADGLEWYLRHRGVRNVAHYLDDFIVIGPLSSQECAMALGILVDACAELGVPLALHKRDGPTTSLIFLGIEVDTVASKLCLPREKLACLQSLLAEWGDKKVCGRRELESLVGILNHACKVVRAGRSFLRRMLDLLKGRQHHSRHPHHIRLNKSFRSDLVWWRLFASRWNGVSFLPPPPHLPGLLMASDASGSWGCGAWHGTHWFQLPWDSRSEALPIMAKELLAVLLACAVWSPSWSHHRVTVLCDNQAVVACLRSRSCHDHHIMHMLRTLAFIEASLAFTIDPQYISTTDNHLADDLSRNCLLSFLSKVPHADQTATPLPMPLVELLLDPSMDWTSPQWHRQFNAIFKMDWPHQLAGSTAQQ